MDTNAVISLISAGSALFGALLGGVISCWTLSKQIRADDMRKQHEEKVKAYTNFLAAYTSYIGYALQVRNAKSRDIVAEMSALHQFSTACAAASLLSPAPITRELNELADLASRYAEGEIGAEEVGKKYLLIQELLHKDLDQTAGFQRQPKRNTD